MFGNGFSREAIVFAHKLRASLDNERIELSHEADRLAGPASGDECKYTTLEQATRGEPIEHVVCFFLLLAKRDGWEARALSDDDYVSALSDGGPSAVELADLLARIVDTRGVQVDVQTSEDDPFRVEFSISDKLAYAWSEYHGALAGGTWECPDGADFVHDYGDTGDIAELQKTYDLNLSEYTEPDERDHEIAEHAYSCPVCDGDFHIAERHWDDPLVMAADHARKLANRRAEYARTFRKLSHEHFMGGGDQCRA